MPSAYTHYCFGKEVYRQLPASLRKEILQGQSFYKTGLLGPDILFYYRPLSRHWINRIGYEMHRKAAMDFFVPSAGRVRNRKQLAYLLGFVCHFVLDSECHGFIAEYMEKTGLSHTEIEMEWDRFLMLRDGKIPMQYCAAGYLLADQEHAAVMHTFFPQVPKGKLRKALRSMKSYDRLLNGPGRCKRILISAVLALTGNYRQMKGLMISQKANPDCEESCQRLMELYEEAVPEAVRLIRNYVSAVREGQALDPAFSRSFDVE